MTMSLKLYGSLLSQPSRAVELFLLVNKIPYQGILIDLLKEDHKTDNFLKLNPFHKIPVIDDNGFVLKESVAILRYLCRERDVPAHWYPKDSKQQAKIDEYLEWHHLDTRLNCFTFFQIKYLMPLITGNPANTIKVKECEEKMKSTLILIEKVWLKDKPYLTANTATIADLLGVCEVEQLRMAGYEARSEYPKIAAWLERVRQEFNPHYDEAHKLLNKIAARVKSS